MSSQLQAYWGMQYTEAAYKESGLSDKEFAVKMTEAYAESNPKFEWSYAQVRQYRQVLSIPNNKPRTEDTAKVAEAKLLFQELLLQAGASLTEDLTKQIEEYLE